MKSVYEVIVAGAGPSGALTAALLALEGHDVLLLDKSDFPRDKVCGEAVPYHALDILDRAGMKDKIEELFSKGAFNPLTCTRLYSPGNQEVVAPLHESDRGYRPCTAPRLIFDAMFQQHAVESGVEFKQARVEELKLENGQVVGLKARTEKGLKEIRARMVVGAEGVNSLSERTLRKGLVRHEDQHRAIALRAYLEGFELNPREVEFHFPQEVIPGYAWIFPMSDGRANVGLGMRLDHYQEKPDSLKKMLEDFIELPQVKKRLNANWKLENIGTWPLNFGSQKGLQFAFNGAVLVGDAAGFINPMTGGGISRGLYSSQLAAEVISKALKENQSAPGVLIEYQKLCDKLLFKEMRRLFKLQVLLQRYPSLLDFIAKRLQKRYLPLKRYLAKL